jgi:hypothetical protein
MRILIEDVFEQIAVDRYEALYFDEEFNEALGRALKMGRKLLHFERTPRHIVRRICYEPDRDPSSPAGQAFGTSRASFVEELDYDLASRKGAWRTIPNLFTERVTNTGTIELAAAGSGVRRTVRGEVKVSLFGFGRIVERMIVAEIENSYARTTELTRAWWAEHAHRTPPT